MRNVYDRFIPKGRNIQHKEQVFYENSLFKKLQKCIENFRETRLFYCLEICILEHSMK